MTNIKSIKIPMNATRILRLAKFEKATGKTLDFILERGLIHLEESEKSKE